MAHNHSHNCHHHHHHHDPDMSDSRLALAVGLNLFLTFAEVAAALISGSLSLLADALHNFSDCASLVVAWIARRISRRGADSQYTFGYKRAEVIGATINLTALIVLGGYLLIEAFMRIFSPSEVQGGIVMWVSAIAIVVDVGTALALMTMAKGNLNIRAAFLHNITDAISSVVVLLGGAAILFYDWNWVDPVLTVVIAAYILRQSIPMLQKAINVLMDGVDSSTDISVVHSSLENLPSILRIYHLHIRQIDESTLSLEARIVIHPDQIQNLEAIKASVKHTLLHSFHISHSTLEFEINAPNSLPPSEESNQTNCGYPISSHNQ